ncbi:hypothetical protein CI109_100137 [Kwoniella shandongensis]|uniref:Uncharacterized protein n=1 Tax=Kwoniella shandongensis TaxID=1734106 RepID=A0A5M6BRX2_9TREE|nr:uncharacterized protein CI109_006835 [Kwoniella shandongensis]KAA5524812.1 hypothetical protein CI109_006835 [Kwoniella shandongensis]
MSKDKETHNLPYVDIQHDALAVFDDVEQGVVLREDIWISGYQVGSTSVHGKARVEFEEGGGSSLTSREGVKVERKSKTNFVVSVSKLGIHDLPVRFPRQVIHPPYKKTSPLDPPLQINSLSLNPKSSHILIGGPDGYALILPISSDASVEKDSVRLQGHVGDVRDVKWFPSGEVILTASSDLSLRVFGKDGVNPRTFKGHTRAITSTAILGVGKQLLSGSKDGTIRLWDVGKGVEVKKWTVEGKKGVEAFVVVEDEDGLRALGVQDQERVLVVGTQEGVWVQPFDGEGWWVKDTTEEEGHLVCLAYDETSGTIVTGHTTGIMTVRHVTTLSKGNAETTTPITTIRRNESPVYSLAFGLPSGSSSESVELYVGTAAGLPCRLSLRRDGGEGKYTAKVQEEFAGWEAVGVECFGVGKEGVWCAGGEGGLRRY